MDKKEFSPRLGFAYSWDQKTVIRGGYGIFWIPNYISFGLNPDNDVINLATTPFVATTNHGLSPAATLDGSNCTLAGVRRLLPLPAQLRAPLVRVEFCRRRAVPRIHPRRLTLQLLLPLTVIPTLAPYLNPKPGYVQQYNLDIQRQLPAGFFADVAYAGSHGVHLQQYSTNINQIPDSFVAQAGHAIRCWPARDDCPAARRRILSPLRIPTLSAPTLLAGQLDRPYPQYTGLSLGGYGCCGSTYNSLQATVTRRFQGGGTLLVAYTNAKLLSNTDTLTSWLEGPTGGVGQVQD